MSIKLLALMGKSGAGKDAILNGLLEHEGFSRVVSCTTRPMREGEVEGVNYHFITIEEFQARAYAEEFIEVVEFNGWFYGSLTRDLDKDKINIGVYTPEGIECLIETQDAYDLDILCIYVECSDKTRVMRALNREDDPNVAEICRRFGADEDDFSYIPFDYYCLDNEDSSGVEIAIDTALKYSKDFFD